MRKGRGCESGSTFCQKGSDRRQAAAFDTRLGSPLAGGAAHGIARRLRRHGYQLASDPEGTYR
jgi:hypothetical protein